MDFDDIDLRTGISPETRLSHGSRPGTTGPVAQGLVRITACPESVHVGRSFPLYEETTFLGREATDPNTILLNDPDVSRQHALLRRVDRGHELHDLNSTNGLFVNGERVPGSRLLAHGDTIIVGATTLTYERRRGTDR